MYRQNSMAGPTAEHGATDSTTAHRQGFQYAGCYCEENVWLLCQRLCDTREAHESELTVVFISNSEQQVWLCEQRAGQNAAGLVVWDYHVLALQRQESSMVVWDLDSLLPLPCCFAHFATAALRIGEVTPLLHRRYRCVPWPAFRRRFASDRRHMRTSVGGWQMPPPRWSCIFPAGSQSGEHNLHQYINMALAGESALPWQSDEAVESAAVVAGGAAVPLDSRVGPSSAVTAAANAAPAGISNDFGEVLEEAEFLARFGTALHDG